MLPGERERVTGVALDLLHAAHELEGRMGALKADGHVDWAFEDVIAAEIRLHDVVGDEHEVVREDVLRAADVLFRQRVIFPETVLRVTVNGHPHSWDPSRLFGQRSFLGEGHDNGAPTSASLHSSPLPGGLLTIQSQSWMFCLPHETLDYRIKVLITYESLSPPRRNLSLQRLHCTTAMEAFLSLTSRLLTSYHAHRGVIAALEAAAFVALVEIQAELEKDDKERWIKLGITPATVTDYCIPPAHSTNADVMEEWLEAVGEEGAAAGLARHLVGVHGRISKDLAHSAVEKTTQLFKAAEQYHLQRENSLSRQQRQQRRFDPYTPAARF
ncbi:hypothetical protein JCM10213_000006 [Rhodosporidiobolus nylandii]